MDKIIIILIGIFIPFMGTILGSAIVLLIKNNVSKKLNKIFLGFASGIMIAASIWSLIIPAIEMAEKQGIPEWLPSCIGVFFGAIFIPIIDKMLKFENLHINSNKKNILLALAITLHNIPEGIF